MNQLTMAFQVFIFFITLLLCLTSPARAAKTSLLMETGAFFQARNDVRIPDNSGTLVGFDDYNRGPFFHYRLEGHYESGRHGVRLIYAPLSLSVKGREGRDVHFNNRVFSANSDINIDFKFNSYRVGYTYRIVGNETQYFKLGITAKVRDAAVTFQQGAQTTTYDNLGFVPLFYYAFNLELDQNWSIFSDADFAYASQGRATDLTLKLRRKLSDGVALSIGYRTLEGGAKNKKVLTFSYFHYAVADLVLTW